MTHRAFLTQFAKEIAKEILTDEEFRRHIRALIRGLSSSSDEALDRVLTVKEVTQLIGLSRQHLSRMARDGHFPKAMQITRSRIGWRRSVILAWLQEREQHPEARRAFFRRTKP